MEFKIHYKLEDFRAWSEFSWHNLDYSNSWMAGAMGKLWIVLAYALTMIIALWFVKELHWPTVFAISAIFLIYRAHCGLVNRENRKAFEPHPSGSFLDTHTFKLDEKEIFVQSSSTASNIKWSAVKRIEKTQDYLFLYIDTNTAIILPKREIDEFDELYAEILTWTSDLDL